MKPKDQNAIVAKEGTAATDLKPGGTFFFSLRTYPTLSVDQPFPFERFMLLNLCFKSSCIKGEWIDVSESQPQIPKRETLRWMSLGANPGLIKCIPMASLCTKLLPYTKWELRKAYCKLIRYSKIPLMNGRLFCVFLSIITMTLISSKISTSMYEMPERSRAPVYSLL